MSAYWTKQNAVMSAYHMWRKGFSPATIMDIGLGGGQEIPLFNWLFPSAKIVAADPRWYRGLVPIEFHLALVGDHVGELSFCPHCHSTKCVLGEHDGVKLLKRCTTVDALAAGKQPPFFLWIDVEGAEIDVLHGAAETLKSTWWISLEVQDLPGAPNQVKEVEDWVAGHRYRLELVHQGTTNRLYRRRR